MTAVEGDHASGLAGVTVSLATWTRDPEAARDVAPDSTGATALPGGFLPVPGVGRWRIVRLSTDGVTVAHLALGFAIDSPPLAEPVAAELAEFVAGAAHTVQLALERRVHERQVIQDLYDRFVVNMNHRVVLKLCAASVRLRVARPLLSETFTRRCIDAVLSELGDIVREVRWQCSELRPGPGPREPSTLSATSMLRSGQ